MRRFAFVLAALGLAASLTPALTPALSAASVAAPAPVVHLSEPDAVLAGLTAPATGSTYTVAQLLNGQPIRWNPCAPIHWQFRAAGAPAGGLTVLKQAVARVAGATGTRWVFDGVVASVPGTAWLPRTSSGVRPVLIGWGDAASSDLLRGQATGVLGVTRTAWFGMTRNGVSTAAIKAAVIVLDRSDRLPLTGPVSWRTVALHELTHAMGLDHAGSSRQLMYPVMQRTVADLQAGDLAGLRRVGAAGGCVTL